MKHTELQRSLEEFRRLDDVSGRSQEDPVRISEQPKLVSSYYDAVTAFYEFAWGKAFHFSPRQARGKPAQVSAPSRGGSSAAPRA